MQRSNQLKKGPFAPSQLVCVLWPLEPPEFQENVLLSEPELWGYLGNFSEQIFWNFLMLLLLYFPNYLSGRRRVSCGSVSPPLPFVFSSACRLLLLLLSAIKSGFGCLRGTAAIRGGGWVSMFRERRGQQMSRWSRIHTCVRMRCSQSADVLWG